jgi:hypothetical protein
MVFSVGFSFPHYFFTLRSSLISLLLQKAEKGSHECDCQARLMLNAICSRFELYSFVTQVLFVPLVLRTYAPHSVSRHGSNFARLADE